MKLILVRCPAKVTLFLDAKSNDNSFCFEALHDTVNIYDNLEIAVSKKFANKVSSVSLSSNHTIDDNRNVMILRAINEFFKYTQIDDYGVRVKIAKNIPSQIGLGSASSDAAGVILGLDNYFDLHLSNKELIDIAFSVGPSVPYFLFGGFKRVTSNGEKIAKENNIRCSEYLIALGKVNVNWDNLQKSVNDALKESIVSNNCQFIECLEGMLPQELSQIKKVLIESKATYASINGVSPTVVGGFNDRHARFNALTELKKQNIKIFSCKPVDGMIIQKSFI